jgi:hypothetical protein
LIKQLPNGHSGAIKAMIIVETTDAQGSYQVVWTGDTNGHVEIWSIKVSENGLQLY